MINYQAQIDNLVAQNKSSYSRVDTLKAEISKLKINAETLRTMRVEERNCSLRLLEIKKKMETLKNEWRQYYQVDSDVDVVSGAAPTALVDRLFDEIIKMLDVDITGFRDEMILIENELNNVNKDLKLKEEEIKRLTNQININTRKVNTLYLEKNSNPMTYSTM